MTARDVLSKAMNEEELLTAITEALTYRGWRWVHYRRSDKAQMMGHSGFPDVCAARGGRILFLELKSESGRQSVDQHEWETALALAFPQASPDHAFFLVRPSDLDFILGIL